MTETAMIELSKNATLLGLLTLVLVLTYKQLVPWLRAYLENQAAVLKEIAAAVTALQVSETRSEHRLGNIEDRLGGIEEETTAIYTKLDMPRSARRRTKETP